MRLTFAGLTRGQWWPVMANQSLSLNHRNHKLSVIWLIHWSVLMLEVLVQSGPDFGPLIWTEKLTHWGNAFRQRRWRQPKPKPLLWPAVGVNRHHWTDHLFSGWGRLQSLRSPLLSLSNSSERHWTAPNSSGECCDHYSSRSETLSATHTSVSWLRPPLHSWPQINYIFKL